METIKNKNGSFSFKEKVYLPDGRTKTKSFARKSDARDWKFHQQLENAKNLALGIEGLKENLCFSEIFEIWMNTKIRPIRSTKTSADYACIGRRHLKLRFGQIKIRSINEHTLKRWFVVLGLTALQTRRQIKS